MYKPVNSGSCSVDNCFNNWYRLKIWRSKVCTYHNVNYGTCKCEPPFQLFCLPKNEKVKALWINNIKRSDANVPSKPWTPKKEARVCSVHFFEKMPTVCHPLPTINMGHESRSTPRKLPKERLYDNVEKSHQNHPSPINEFDCAECVEKDDEIKKLKFKIKSQGKEINLLKQKYADKVKKPFGSENVNDSNIKFFTGFTNLKAFNVFFHIILPLIMNLRYWRSNRKVSHPLKHKQGLKKKGPSRCLAPKDELLLTLMKVRLGLLNQDLACRFGVSKCHVSNIFTTWIKFLSQYLKDLIFNPAKEIVSSNLPPCFQNSTYKSVRHIIDCTEVFLETPKDLSVKANTWSDYKHHNTAKIFVSITPSGFINFVSTAWGGRTSDKHITNYCGFLDIVEPYDKVLADRGFTIADELTLRNAELLIPPGRRGAAQFTEAEVKKTKQIANRRIYIEQAIRRMKCFRIRKYELPLTLLHHLDDILMVVSGLCNLLPPLPKYSK